MLKISQIDDNLFVIGFQSTQNDIFIRFVDYERIIYRRIMRIRRDRTTLCRNSTIKAYRPSINAQIKQNHSIKRNTSQIIAQTDERIHKSIESINKLYEQKHEQSGVRPITRTTTVEDSKKYSEFQEQKAIKQKKRILFNIRSLNIQKKAQLSNNPQIINKKAFNLTYFTVRLKERCDTQSQRPQKLIINQQSFTKNPPIHNKRQQTKMTRRIQDESQQLFHYRFFQNSKIANSISNDRQFDDNLTKYLNQIKQHCNYHNIVFNQFRSYPKQYLSYYIQTGNNDRMIMDILSKRWWWEINQQNSEEEGINLKWTQIVHQGHGQRQQDRLCKIKESKEQFQSETLMNLKRICFYNHFRYNKYLTNNISLAFLMGLKSHHRLFYNIFFPITFYINELNSQSWLQFTKCHFSFIQQDNPQHWIIKNAQNKRNFNFFKILHSYQEIKEFIESRTTKEQSFIIQQYISRPILYRNRKFDIQAHMLVTKLNGVTRGYWYRQGFVNVSHEEFTIKKIDPFIHLVTDSIQINHKKFGDFQNKIRFQHFQKYCASLRKHKFSFIEKVMPIMKDTAKYLIEASQDIIFNQASQATFEIFELKFILGNDLIPWLVSVNANHSLSTTSPTLQAIYPMLVDDTFKLTLDLYFPPPTNWPLHKKFFMSASRENGYELIYEQGQQYGPKCGIKRIEDIEFWERVDEDIKVYEEIQERDSLSIQSRPQSGVKDQSQDIHLTQ